MKLYRITLVDVPGETAHYRKEREHARHVATQAVDYRAARIDQIEIHPQADEIVDMLNGTYTFARTVSAQRTWGLKASGALVELQPGE